MFGTNRALLLAIQRSLRELHAKADILMTQQDDINTEAAQIEADVAAEGTATQAIKDAIAALEAQVAAGQPADLTALKQAVTDLDSATAAEQARDLTMGGGD